MSVASQISSFSLGAGCSSNGNEPVRPNRRINGRTVGPSGAPKEKRDLLGVLALSLPGGLKEHAHRLIALDHSNLVGCRGQLAHQFRRLNHESSHLTDVLTELKPIEAFAIGRLDSRQYGLRRAGLVNHHRD